MSGMSGGDYDQSFIDGMVPHHQAAIDMAKVAQEMVGGDMGDGLIRVLFVSCRNDAGARLAEQLLRRLGGARFAVVGAEAAAPPDYAVILCPPDCDT